MVVFGLGKDLLFKSVLGHWSYNNLQLTLLITGPWWSFHPISKNCLILKMAIFFLNNYQRLLWVFQFLTGFNLKTKHAFWSKSGNPYLSKILLCLCFQFFTGFDLETPHFFAQILKRGLIKPTFLWKKCDIFLQIKRNWAFGTVFWWGLKLTTDLWHGKTSLFHNVVVVVVGICNTAFWGFLIHNIFLGCGQLQAGQPL